MIPSIKARQAEQVWVGIDPGMSGGIGALNEKGEFLWVVDMPITHEGRTGEFDLDELVSIVCEVARSPDPHVRMEWPTTRPDEAAESSKRFGVGLGLLEGMFAFAGCPAVRVAPNKWKGRLGLKGKEFDQFGARKQAVEFAENVLIGLHPNAVRGVRGGLLDGRAEALLIAWEGLTSTVAGLRSLSYEMRLARMMFGGGRRKRKGGPF